MMPGETHSKVAGIASEAVASCQNCTSLQQCLNEYVAALITLKQKIIDSDHLLAEYQQKCDDLQCVKRENETLRCQLEQKKSPQEQNEKELMSLRARLEEKESALKAFRQTHWEWVKVKAEYEKDHYAKKELEAKFKKMEEAAERHVNDNKQLQLDKKLIEKELKKMQKKLGDIQNVKCKKAMKNAKIQVANEQPIVRLNKKKIKILLEELWGCIQSSTEKGDDDQLILETKFESSNLKNSFDYTSSLTHSCPSVVRHKLNTSSESSFVSESHEFAQCKRHKTKCTYDMTIEKCAEANLFCEETPKNVLKDLNDICPLTSDHENDMEELVKIINWAKPLPLLLSPLKCSPLTTKHAFGELTDSSDNELYDTTLTNETIDCKAPDNKTTCVQLSSCFLSVKGIGNVLKNCKQNDRYCGNVESSTVAYGMKSQCKSDITSVTEAGKGRNSPETLVPSTEFSSVHCSKKDLSVPVGYEISNNIDKPVDTEDITETIEIKNMPGSENNGSSSGPVVKCNTTDFPNLFPYQNEIVTKEFDFEGYVHADNTPSVGHIHVSLKKNVKGSSLSVTCDGQDISKFSKSSEMCLSSKNNYQLNTVQSHMFGQNKNPTSIDCLKSNSLEELNSRRFDTTPVNEEMPCIHDRVPKQKSKHLESTPVAELKHEYADMVVQCSVAKTNNCIPSFIQEMTIQKSSMSPKQNVPLKTIKGDGQCCQERSASSVGSDVAFTSTLADNSFDADDQTKMSPNELDAVHTENMPDQRASVIQNEKACELKRDACEIDITNSAKKYASSTAQNIVLAKVQSLQTEMHLNEVRSDNEPVYDYSICSEKKDQLHSIVLPWNVKITAGFDATNCNHHLNEEVEDLVTDGNDKNNTNTLNMDAEPNLASQINHHLNYVEFSQSKLPPVSMKKLHHLDIPLETKHFNEITDKTDSSEDLCGVSLDSEEDNFLVRKVSNTRAVSNLVNLMKSCKSSSENDDKVCNVDFGLDSKRCNTVVDRWVHENYARDLPCVGSKNESTSSKKENGLFMEQKPSAKVVVDAGDIMKNYSNDQREESALVIECKRQEGERVYDPTINIGANAGINLNTFETKPRKILPGKNLIWNFGRTGDSLDLREVLGKQKRRANSEKIYTSSKTINSVFNVKLVRKEDNQQRLCKDKNILQTSRVRQTVLANADTSTSSVRSPDTINKVRSEMGQPLPPLLGPLLATPPKMMRSLLPTMSSSSHLLLPSPPDDLISSLPGTSFPPLVSPLSDGSKQPLSLNTLSFADKANQRILSSPLQFCAVTPKHALPVPGRLPPSASGSSTTSVQENSVKILDTIYPELSARARTLNILKGHVHLNRDMPVDNKDLHVSRITGFKPITSTSTAFMKTVSNLSTYNCKAKLRSCGNQKPHTNSPLNKRTTDSILMPKSAKRLCLDSGSPVMETVKDHSTIPVKDIEIQKPSESLHIGYCESLPDVVKDGSIDEEVITNALKQIEDLSFDLLPVVRSHIFVGTIPKVPIMRNEEKEVIYEFSNSKKSLADRFLHVVLRKIRAGKTSMPRACLQALCRVYVGLCRQLGDIERARILCYSILKEDFPDPDRLLLFIVSSWNDILSTHGVVSKAIQAILKTLAKEEVGYCLSAYLSWEKACTPSMNVSVLLSSVLMAMQLYPDVKFQQSEKYGEDLTDCVWEYVFAVDLLCSHRKWVWTHDNVISKELWPLLDKWVKRRKGNQNVTFVPDIIVAAVLRLLGRLCRMGLKEGFVTAVKNISTVIITFLQHANEEGMPWGMQLSCVYMLCDLAPSDPATIFKTLQVWKNASRNDIPPAIGSCLQEAESTCELKK